MSVTQEVEVEIRRLHYGEHWPVGTVATQVNVHVDVVKRVLGLLEARATNALRPRAVDEYVSVGPDPDSVDSVYESIHIVVVVVDTVLVW